MNELEKIKQLPKTKAEIALFAERIMQSLEEGDINPLTLLGFFKGMEKVMEHIKPTLTRLSITEASKHPKNEAILDGVKYTVREGAGKYDFSTCGDTVWGGLKEYMEEYSRQIKEREEFLKTIKGTVEIVNKETGEIAVFQAPVQTFNAPSIVTSFT